MKRLIALLLALSALPLIACSKGLEPAPEEAVTDQTKTLASTPQKEEKKEEETEEPEFEDPKEDGELNIILIGNSYSYYWCDELYGMLAAAGHEDAKVYNVYYSGCSFDKHWNWLVGRESNYSLFCNDKNGRNEYKGVDLIYCLGRENWDIISYQQSGKYVYGTDGSEENLRNSIDEHLPLLHKYVSDRFPLAQYYWLQSWVHEIGDGSKGLTSLEEQKTITAWHRVVGKEVCEKYGFIRVPCGDAWEDVRHNSIIKANGFTLTTRVQKGKQIDDLSHDGDMGGGQYLNACVWFERITGQSCVGNSFRPKYVLDGKDVSLTEEKITLLQNAAHHAVLNMEKR